MGIFFSGASGWGIYVLAVALRQGVERRSEEGREGGREGGRERGRKERGWRDGGRVGRPERQREREEERVVGGRGEMGCGGERAEGWRENPLPLVTARLTRVGADQVRGREGKFGLEARRKGRGQEKGDVNCKGATD